MDVHLFEDFRKCSGIDLHKLLARRSVLDSFRPMARKQPTCSLLRSLPNCWKPSSRVTKVADSFDAAELRACNKRFLSSSVLRRSLSYSRMSNRSIQPDGADLCLFLKVEGIDTFQLSFLGEPFSRKHCC